MRAAEILVGLLLNEALPKVIAVAFGPGLPAEGSYAGGGNEAIVYRKFKQYLPQGHLGIKRITDEEDTMDTWIMRGFSILLRRNDGSLCLFGKPIQVDERIVRIYGLQSGTPITHYTRKPGGGGLNKTMSNASATLGVQ